MLAPSVILIINLVFIFMTVWYLTCKNASVFQSQTLQDRQNPVIFESDEVMRSFREG